MYIFVGSTNPVKINATINAASETWPDVIVKGYEVFSGIAEQPRTDDETRMGSENRAKNVLALGLKSLQRKKLGSFDNLSKQVLGIGLEGGVFLKDKNELWSTVWATAIDVNGNLFQSNGARFKVPDIIAQKLLAGGEMGPVVSKLINKDNIKQKSGAIGVITKSFIDRTEEYVGIVKLALGLWYGRNWEAELK